MRKPTGTCEQGRYDPHTNSVYECAAPAELRVDSGLFNQLDVTVYRMLCERCADERSLIEESDE